MSKVIDKIKIKMDKNPTDAVRITQEKTIAEKEKELLKTYLELGLFLNIIVFYITLHYMGVKADNQGIGFKEGINLAITYAISKPFNFLPMYPSVGAVVGKGMGSVIITSIVVFLMYSLQRPRLQHNRNNIKGSSKWGDAKKMEIALAEPFGEYGHDDTETNFIYSDLLFISYRSRDITNCNTLVIGEPGTGKSRGYVKPNLLQMNCSYIVTDPSGDILKQVGETLYRFGYNVRIFDLSNKTHCSTYNPMKYCYKDDDVKSLVNAFIENTNTGGENSSADPFWDAAMNAYLCAIISLLVNYGDNPDIMDGYIYRKDFANLCDLARMSNEPLDEKYMDDATYKAKPSEKTQLGHIFNNLKNHEELWEDDGKGTKKEPYCLKKWRDFVTTPGKTADTILATAKVRLDAFNIDAIANLTSTDTIHLEDFGTKRDVLFIIIPVRDKTYNFLTSFMYTQLFDILYNRGEHHVQKSYTLQLKDKEFVKWYDETYSKEEVDEDVEIIKASHIEKVIVDKGNDDYYYEIIDKLGRVVSRRPTEVLAEKYLKDLKEAELKKHSEESVENPIHIRFLQDEFANTGKVPNYPALLTTVRKYNISCDIIIQGTSQLKEMYKETWGVIDVGCYITVFLGGTEKETTEFISQKMGKMTTIVGNISIDNKKFSHSNNADGQELMTPDEIGRLPNSDMLVLITGHYPLRLKKYNYPSHPMYQYTADYMTDKHLKKMRFDFNRYPMLKYVKQKFEAPVKKCKIKIYECMEGLDEETLADLFCCDTGELENVLMDGIEKVNQEDLGEDIFEDDDIFGEDSVFA